MQTPNLFLGFPEHVHSSHVDTFRELVLRLLQFVHATSRLLGIVRFEVVRRVCLAEVLSLFQDPRMIKQHLVNLNTAYTLLDQCHVTS